MALSLYKRIASLTLLLIVFIGIPSYATHIMGGGLSYRLISNGSGSTNNYEITLVLYQDCASGDNAAIEEDDPMFIKAFNQYGATVYVDSIHAATLTFVPSVQGCASTDSLCMKEARYVITINLSQLSAHTVAIQRCCRNADVQNLLNGLNVGTTFYCEIPGGLTPNNSAVFDSLPPQYTVINENFAIDCHATDVDGHSLSYELTTAYSGGSQNDAKPMPSQPPYSPAGYSFNYSPESPISGSLTLNANTGQITGDCNLIGKYVINIACHEWQYGTIINTNNREFELICKPSSSTVPVLITDTAVIVGTILNLSCPPGSLSYNWSPSTNLNDSIGQSVTATFLSTGNYQYFISTTEANSCQKLYVYRVQVTETAPQMRQTILVPTAFTPNNDNLNDLLRPVAGTTYRLKSFRVFDRWGRLLTDNIAGWDGAYQNSPMPMDSYNWIATLLNNRGETVSESGSTYLIR